MEVKEEYILATYNIARRRELAEYCGKQFIDLWTEFRLI